VAKAPKSVNYSWTRSEVTICYSFTPTHRGGGLWGLGSWGTGRGRCKHIASANEVLHDKCNSRQQATGNKEATVSCFLWAEKQWK